LYIPPHLKRVATLLSEIVVFKNRNDPELCEENCHARLSHSKHLLKNIYQVTLASDKEIKMSRIKITKVTVVRPIQKSIGKWKVRPPVKP